MTDTQSMAERHAATLARLAEAAERLAMKHAERALACDDPAVEATATTAFHKAARCVRQCVALEARLLRDAERDQRQATSSAEFAGLARTEHRKSQLRAAVDRHIRNEAGSDREAENLCDELDDLLDFEALAETFLTEEIEPQIAKLLQDLGVTLSEPPPAPAPNPAPEPQSSA